MKAKGAMSLSQDQAAESLKEIDRTSRRSASAYSYAHTSPYLMLWGVIWMVGYSASDTGLRLANWLWLGLLVIGVAGNTLIGRRQALSGPPQAWLRHPALRFFATFFAVWMFIGATYAIFGHAGARQQAAFVPLIVALIYVVMGIWKGPRFLVMGIALAGLTLGGFFFLKDHFLLWMGMVGGGALLLGGFWMKTI
ncbi:MAG TPA: hypothetical protein VFI23_05340 [Rhizomicrobium sp.]|nr:hypothetical protein [Rhizomicrobium sp.]